MILNSHIRIKNSSFIFSKKQKIWLFLFHIFIIKDKNSPYTVSC